LVIIMLMSRGAKNYPFLVFIRGVLH
jgi:hypothetical protein